MNGTVCTCWRLRPDGTHGASCPVAIAEAPALTYNGTEGANQAPASQERADRRATSRAPAETQVLILADLSNHGFFGATCAEAEGRVGMSHETYTGSRTNLHRRGAIVRLAERRDRRHVYVLPDTLAAADEIAAWVAANHDAGLVVPAPNYASLLLLIHHAKGTP